MSTDEKIDKLGALLHTAAERLPLIQRHGAYLVIDLLCEILRDLNRGQPDNGG